MRVPGKKNNFVFNIFDGNSSDNSSIMIPAPPCHSFDGGIEFCGVTHLDLAATLDCGQTFRWFPGEDGRFYGITRGILRSVSLQNSRLKIFGASEDEADFWKSYFALDIDYSYFFRLFSKDPILKECLGFSPGIRVLRQDFFEVLLSFIISQNNNIPRIKGIIKRFCRAFGKPAGILPNGDKAFSFPAADVVASLSENDLSVIGAGYRVSGLLDAARKYVSGDFDGIASLTDYEARKLLITVRGVGPKVADCVLLFGLGRFASFPVDVWIGRAMSSLFPNGLPVSVIPFAGIAQQYIFYYARTNGIR